MYVLYVCKGRSTHSSNLQCWIFNFFPICYQLPDMYHLCYYVVVTGAGPGNEEEDDEVPENAWWRAVANSPLYPTVADHHGSRWHGAVTMRVQTLSAADSMAPQWPSKGPPDLMFTTHYENMTESQHSSDHSFLAASWSIHVGESVLWFY